MTVERLAKSLYEQATRKPGTAYSWDMLVALSNHDGQTAKMLERYRAQARSMLDALRKGVAH